METVITVATALGGMLFSLGVALLAEELIFGKVLPALARQTIQVKPRRQL